MSVGRGMGRVCVGGGGGGADRAGYGMLECGWGWAGGAFIICAPTTVLSFQARYWALLHQVAKSDQLATSRTRKLNCAFHPFKGIQPMPKNNSCTVPVHDLNFRTQAYKPCFQAIASLAMSCDRLKSKSAHSSRELVLLKTLSWAVSIEHCRL